MGRHTDHRRSIPPQNDMHTLAEMLLEHGRGDESIERAVSKISCDAVRMTYQAVPGSHPLVSILGSDDAIIEFIEDNDTHPAASVYWGAAAGFVQDLCAIAATHQFHWRGYAK